MAATVYILLCADGSYYTGFTRQPLTDRLEQHASGRIPCYTAPRRPVKLVWAWEACRDQDAFELEQRIKGWSRAKKQALIRGDMDELQRLARSYANRGLRGSSPSTGSGR
jgi:predicted GIY-YIG superfamily endonuclease